MATRDLSDLRRFRVFYEVTKTGSFSAAAEALALSQPTVSRLIQELEAELDVQLFFRHGRGAVLSAEGQLFLHFVETLFSEANSLHKLFTDPFQDLTGALRIAITPALGATWLMHHLAPFLVQHPQLRLTLFGTLDPVDLHQADVLIRTFLPHQPTLTQRYLHRFRMRFYASEAYLKKYGTPQHVDDLDQHRLLTLSPSNDGSTVYPNLLLQLGRRPRLNTRTPYLQLHSAEGLLQAAQENLGIVELAEDYCTLKGASLAPILTAWEAPPVEVYYIYPTKLHTFAKITGPIDYLEQVLGNPSGT